MSVRIEQCEGAVRVRVRVQPRASRTELAGEHGEALRVRIAAPPVEGDANRELVRFLAKRIGVATSSVRVVRGLSSRDKLVEVDGVEPDRVRVTLGLS